MTRDGTFLDVPQPNTTREAVMNSNGAMAGDFITTSSDGDAEAMVTAVVLAWVLGFAARRVRVRSLDRTTDGWVVAVGATRACIVRLGLCYEWIGPGPFVNRERDLEKSAAFSFHKEVAHARHGRLLRDGRRRRASRRHARR